MGISSSNFIFLYSLPKSGSTLLQRILSTSEDLYTMPETWLLLPLFYSFKEGGVYSEFNGKQLRVALNDNFPLAQRDGYYLEVQKFYFGLFQRKAGGYKKYYLEKTPRYLLVKDEIEKTFPEAKRLVLTRNPLMIMNSMMQTYSAGRYNLFRFRVDLLQGNEKVSELLDSGNVLHIRYEDLLENPQREVSRMEEYLGIKLGGWEKFNKIVLGDGVGDPVGHLKYKEINPKRALVDFKINPVRKIIFKYWLRKIGSEALRKQGYSLTELVDQVNAAPATYRFFLSDILIVLVSQVLYVSVFRVLIDSVSLKKKRFVW